MPTLLRDLVAEPRLGLRTVTESPLPQIAVHRGYVTDLPDPSRYLQPGDLILTSCLWLHEDADCDRFVARLRNSGAVALVAGLAGLEPAGVMPPALVRACLEHELPLLTLGPDKAFGPICEFVLLHRMAGQGSADTRIANFQGRLISTVGAGHGAPEAVQLLREFGVDAWFVREDLEVVTPDGTDPPEPADVAAVVAACTLASGTSVEVTTSAGVARGWPLSSPWGHALGALVTGPATVPDLERLVLPLLSVLGLELRLRHQTEAGEGHRFTELVRLLADERTAPGEVSAHLRLLGADPRLPVLFTAVSGQGGFGLAPAIRTALTEALGEVKALSGALPAELSADPTQAVLLLNGPDLDTAQVAGIIRTRLERADLWPVPSSAGSRILVGISDPVTSVSGTSEALRTARTRLAAAAEQDAPVGLVSGNRLDSHVGLLSALPRADRAEFGRSVLAPLLRYDREHGSDLLATLNSFLTTCGAWQRSADELNVHVNTLRYRVHRIEQLCARDLGSMTDRVDLFLALDCLAETQAGQNRPGSP
jgi:hypothetical protein